MVLQVILLMWLRTTINYQMATGVPFFTALGALYAEGGVMRFYQGIWFALLQAPLSRFGDTAANSGILSALEGSTIPVAAKTGLASAAAAIWRIVIMPIDTTKTLMQVHGARAFAILSSRIASDGLATLYSGAAAACIATYAGHFPWFFTNNQVSGTCMSLSWCAAAAAHATGRVVTQWTIHPAAHDNSSTTREFAPPGSSKRGCHFLVPVMSLRI